MTVDDIPAVMEIESQSFPTPWSASSFRYEIVENPYASLFVMRGADRRDVRAFACVWIIDAEMKINNFAVDPAWRGQGLGTQFMRFLLDFARRHGCIEASLEVRPSNAVALRLYRGIGFLPVGRRRNYYTDSHEDALVMAGPLVGRGGA